MDKHDLPEDWQSYPFDVQTNYLCGRYTRAEAVAELRSIVETDGENRSQQVSNYELAGILILLDEINVGTPPTFGSWDLHQQSDWVRFKLGRDELLNRVRPLVGTDGEGRSDQLGVSELTGLLAKASGRGLWPAEEV